MSSALNHAASINDVDHIRVLDRAETVRNDDRSTAFGYGVQCGLDLVFACWS
jgi:hypothetical protein